MNAHLPSPASSFSLALTLLTAYLLKSHYSLAAVEDLRWVLAPTALVVELLSGEPFSFEPRIGYLSQGSLVAITKACAGLNFLIITGVLLSLLWLPAQRSPARQALAFFLAWLVAGVGTLVVNGCRVLVAMALHGPHRTEGTALYFGALLVIAGLASRFRPEVGSTASRALNNFTQSAPNWSQPRFVILLSSFVYLTGTLLVPWLNGAAQEHTQTFLRHASEVLSVTIGLATLAWIASTSLNRTASRTHQETQPCEKIEDSTRIDPPEQKTPASAAESDRLPGIIASWGRKDGEFRQRGGTWTVRYVPEPTPVRAGSPQLAGRPTSAP